MMDKGYDNGSGGAPRAGAAPLARPGVPVMTLALILVNLLMALAQFTASGFRWSGLTGDIGSDPVVWALGAKVPSLVAHGEYWRLVTASFLHADWIHLLLNLLGLLV